MTAAARASALAWSGLLPVDKPAGMTSHDVVDRARRRLRQPGVGHLGTLDPGASGLLVLVLGAATRCSTVWQGGEKRYTGQAHFGIVTDTQDLQGRVLERCEPRIDEASVRAASARLTGDLQQVPPMVSALKHQGRRLYELARRGETVERAARPVHVAEWTWASIGPAVATFTVRCSGGTYVRTLVHDLGAALGCGAALGGLRRLASLPFTIEGACPWSRLDAGTPEDVLAEFGVPLARALEVLPSVRLEAPAAEAAGHGRRVAVRAGEAPLAAGPRSVVLRDPDGVPIALGELEPAAGEGAALACPHVVFPWAVREGSGA